MRLMCGRDSDVMKRRRRVQYVARVEDRSGSYMVLVVKPEGNGRLGGTSSSSEDNIKMDLREIL